MERIVPIDVLQKTLSKNQTSWSSPSPSAMPIVTASLLQRSNGEGDRDQHALEVRRD